ncbi:MAG TPA: GGDEF domain-containing protein [Phycisphaerales bacterium]|nr:GGDEF domain-containing protein [Phycisphaerales bacterium]
MNADPKNAAPLPDPSFLDALIEQRAVSTVFQPIVCVENAEVSGFESLARPNKGTGVPHVGAMFDMAERDGRLWDLEDVTRRSSFESAGDFPNGVLLFTNSTPDVFTDPRFPQRMQELVESVPGLTPSRVVLEITERAGGDDLERVAQQVQKLKQLGFQIAIDDVGAGTSGLTRIMMLRPHWIKIDRELVSGIDRNRYKLNLIRFMVHFARLSGVNVIAEGIERHEELAALISLGVRYVQGFLIARPSAAYQTIDPKLAAWTRARWQESEQSRGDDPRRSTLASLCQPVESAQMTTPLGDLALSMLRKPESLGIAVLDGTRLVGWCGRDHMLNAARSADPRMQIGFISSADLGTLPPTATIGEGLELVSSRQDQYLADPLIVAEHDEIVGIVTMRRLLAATVGETRLWGGSAAGLTGLPGKIASEKRAKSLIAGRKAGIDAAFIDIRGFSRYNGCYGYDMGDRLIQDVASLLRSHLVAGDDEAFIAHLGDDRFIATGSSATLERRLAAMVEEFDKSVEASPPAPAWTLAGGTLAEASGAAALGQIGLRVLLLDQPFSDVACFRDLLDREAALRLAVRDDEQNSQSRSIIIRADEHERRRAAA